MAKGWKRSGTTNGTCAACRISAEILGTTVHHLTVDMGNVVPDSDVVAAAKQRGKAHLIKRLHQEERFVSHGRGRKKKLIRVVRTEIETVDPQKAISQLMKIFGLKNLHKRNYQ